MTMITVLNILSRVQCAGVSKCVFRCFEIRYFASLTQDFKRHVQIMCSQQVSRAGVLHPYEVTARTMMLYLPWTPGPQTLDYVSCLKVMGDILWWDGDFANPGLIFSPRLCDLLLTGSLLTFTVLWSFQGHVHREDCEGICTCFYLFRETFSL